MTRDYWIECIAVAFDEAGIVATDEQIKSVANTVEGGHESYGMAFHQPESPYPGEIKRLEAELAKERSKVVCRYCNGTGRIISYGPVHSSESQCWRCCGEGKVQP